jgi:hypothetical protein
MRRLVTVTAAAALLLLGIPSSGLGQPPARDSVAGQLFSPERGLIFIVEAQSGPSGENPTGTVQWAIGGGAGLGWGGSVTCLAVRDSTAVIGFSGTHNPGFEMPIHPVTGLIRVADGGGVESGLDSFEWAETLGPAGGAPIPGPSDCSAFPGPFARSIWSPPGGVVNDFGDLIVIDTQPPLPTTKEQCKDGGWRNFPVFKNQGDCVSFVATGGKNPPGTKLG